MTEREKFESICDLTTNLVGLHKGALANKTRKQTIHIPRMVASVIGRIADDIHPTTIAKVLGRDRTSVLHYYKCHGHNYSTFPEYRTVFNKVYNAYSEILSTKKTFLNNDEMRMFLISKGVNVVQKPQVVIIVESGNAKYKFNTNYFDFTKNADIIREALKDYRYFFKIKPV